MNLGKRKLPEEPTEALLKKYRADDGAARERTRIEDVNDEDEMEEDDEPAGPSLPDDFDGDEDEEGGRMYGGGITSEMRRVFEVSLARSTLLRSFWKAFASLKHFLYALIGRRSTR